VSIHQRASLGGKIFYRWPKVSIFCPPPLKCIYILSTYLRTWVHWRKVLCVNSRTQPMIVPTERAPIHFGVYHPALEN
jgi:hypothetical protein